MTMFTRTKTAPKAVKIVMERSSSIPAPKRTVGAGKCKERMNVEHRTSNSELRTPNHLHSRLCSFDIRRSAFDVRRSSVFSLSPCEDFEHTLAPLDPSRQFHQAFAVDRQ